MSPKPLFNRITIIGLGLIGGSIARAAHKYKLAAHIVGCDPNEVSLAYARKHGFVHDTTTDISAAAQDSDLIILSAPPSALSDISERMAPNIKQDAIVMDACSVKQAAISVIEPHIPMGVHFVPCHPIAGSQHSGITASQPDLFAHKRVIVTPPEPLQDPLKQKVINFWEGMGAKLEGMPPHLHDMIYAYVSHLPQLLAFAAAHSLQDYLQTDEALLKKFTRLCDSSPELWIDIFTLNHDNILKALDRYLDAVSHIHGELKKAPKGSPSEEDAKKARTILFPRIAASCLVTTVMEAEKKAGFSFKRYAGGGFADFTAPVSVPPDEDIEQISNQYAGVSAVLSEYILRLKLFRDVLVSGAGVHLEMMN